MVTIAQEIDVGEKSVRSIASGLREFYDSASDIQNRKVLVLVNLKERPLAGFKSQVRRDLFLTAYVPHLEVHLGNGVVCIQR